VLVVQWARPVPPLKQVSAVAILRIEIHGIAPLCLAKRTRHGPFVVERRDNQVSMIVHKAILIERAALFFALLSKQFQKYVKVVRTPKNRLATIASHASVVLDARNDDPSDVCHTHSLSLLALSRHRQKIATV
jgi:hypothetical protein